MANFNTHCRKLLACSTSFQALSRANLANSFHSLALAKRYAEPEATNNNFSKPSPCGKGKCSRTLSTFSKTPCPCPGPEVPSKSNGSKSKSKSDYLIKVAKLKLTYATRTTTATATTTAEDKDKSEKEKEKEASEGGGLKKLSCWKCSTRVDSSGEFGPLLCPNPECQSPQRLRGADVPDYYELLGAQRTYQVDVESLALKVKRLQRKLHPDLFAQRVKEEQELSQELSSLINKAFGTLSNPIERGRYLLQLHGVKDPIGDVEKELTSDPEFLEEVMELNERLVELASEEEWMEFRKQNEISLHQLRGELNEAFNNKHIPEAKLILGRMKYYDTLQGKLKELKSKLGIVE